MLTLILQMTTLETGVGFRGPAAKRQVAGEKAIAFDTSCDRGFSQ